MMVYIPVDILNAKYSLCLLSQYVFTVKICNDYLLLGCTEVAWIYNDDVFSINYIS